MENGTSPTDGVASDMTSDHKKDPLKRSETSASEINDYAIH